MLLVPTFVGPSKIEGVGLFASEHIEDGALIWKLDPCFDRFIRVVDLPNLPVHIQKLVEIYAFPYAHDSSFLVLEPDNGRFMNHSSSPNTRFEEDTGFALGEIRAGEEILGDYSEFDPAFKIFPGRHFVPVDGS
ncbi:MAG: uncharacterized protein QOH04_1727 [Sphingomonadales bacterium]|jgi:SET domain-containing protein|nr:uncharacterized protein [Sphingomonadales bacterium]